jgi:hypothetical protein
LLRLLVLSVTLAACSRSSPSAAPDDAGKSSGSASGASASTPAASSPLDASAGAGPRCRYTLDVPPASIGKVPTADLARAVIPSLDPKTMLARPLPGGPVVDCLDDPSDADWSGHPPPVPARGKIEVAQRQALSGGRELVWAMTGYPQGACSAEDGFVAIEHLEGAVVVADAVGRWSQPCGAPQKVRVARLGGDEVYAEDSAVGTGAQTSVTEELWKVEGKRLVSIGEFDVAGSAGGIENEGHWLYEMTANPELKGDMVLLHETWTWTSSLPADAAPPAKTRSNLRKFWLEGGKLKALSPEGPPAMP